MNSTKAAAPARPAGMARLAVAFALLTALAIGLANALAYSPWLSALAQIGSPGSLSIGHELWMAAQWGILIGGLLGIAQWVVIRRWLRRLAPGDGGPSGETGRRRDRDAAWWIVVTVAGTLAGMLLDKGLVLALYPATAVAPTPVSIALSALSGTLLGAAQWCLLRRRAARAAWWIVLSAVGKAAGVALIHAWTINIFYAVRLQIYALGIASGLALGVLQGAGLLLLAPLTAEPAVAKGRSRGWPGDRGARLLVVVGLVSFAIGLFTRRSFELGSPTGIRALFDYAVLAPPYSVLPVLGLLLIPLSALVAAARHAWAAVTAGIGTGYALLPFLEFLANPAWLRIPCGPICWLTGGLLLTVGWIVAGRRQPAVGSISIDEPDKGTTDGHR